MHTPPATPSTVTAAAAARAAAEAAGRAAAAVALAAEHANRTGGRTSEFKVTVGAMLLAGAGAALNALAVIPGPWQLFAGLGIGALGAASFYAQSRGKVKAAALNAAAMTGSGPVHLPPG